MTARGARVSSGAVFDPDVEAEQAVLGSLLSDTTGIERVKGVLDPGDFLAQGHAAIYRAMLNVHEQGSPTDFVVISNALRPVITEVGGMSYLASLAKDTASAINLDHYARIVLENSVRRGLIKVSEMVLGAGPMDEKVVRAMELLDRAKTRLVGGEHAEQRAQLLIFDSMEDVQEEEVDWLWHPYIPLGKLVLIEGDPGTKKSWLSLALAAHMSRGWPLPGDNQPGFDPARTLLFAAEDGLGDTVKHRLKSMCADLTMIRPVVGLLREDEEMPLTLDEEGIAAITAMVEVYHPRLVILDPLVAYTCSGTDMNKASEVRRMLQPIISMAREHNIAVVALRHFSKAAGVSPTYKGQGSIDYFAAARSVLAVAQDRDNPSRSIMAQSKSSLALAGKSMAFSIGPGPHGSTFRWEGVVDATAEELLAPVEDPSERSALEEAKRFVHDALFEGPQSAKEVYREAKQNGISERTLHRAKMALNVVSRKERGAGAGWMWELPDAAEHPLGNVGNVGNVTDLAAPSQENGKVAKVAKVANDEEERRQWWNKESGDDPF